tara:strand:+ start:701 stop:979 length:279 start_codon:yes stop_codon:yes gene_type:complete
MKRISQWGSTACISMMGLMISQISMADSNQNKVNKCVTMIANFCDDFNRANENDSLLVREDKNKKFDPCQAHPRCGCDHKCLLALCLSKKTS